MWHTSEERQMTRHGVYRKFLVLLFILIPLAAAAAEPRPDRLDREAVLLAARDVTPEKYPDADDVLVDDLIRETYQPDGTSVNTDDTYIKVLTDKGRQENRTLSFHFTIPYSRVRVETVEVIKPDGTTVGVDVEQQSRVMTDPSQMGQNIYNPNDKVLQVSVPALDVGDVLHYFSIRETVKPRVPDTWSDYMVFEYTSPIRRLTYEVVAPKARPLRRIALRDPVAGTVSYSAEETQDHTIHRWVVRDVPRMYEEPDMPPLETVVQRLLVSTIPGWEEISRWYWRLCEPHLETTDQMRRTVGELTSGLAGRQEKIEALFRFVSQQVRYLGLTMETEAPGYEPHDVRVTFENRYGVCRDKAALLVAMLRDAGIEAFPVLIHSGPKKDAEVPQPYFNHAVVAAKNPDGTYLLMDPTDENTRDLFPAYLADRSYLVATPEGDPLRTSPIVPAENNLVRIETHARLSPRGDLRAESVVRFEGVNDSAYRGYFSRIKPSERRLYFEGILKQAIPGARLAHMDIEPEDVRDTSRPLSVRLQFEADDLVIRDSQVAIVPLPRLGARVGMVNFVIERAGLRERKYPLVTGFACGVEEAFNLDLDSALGPSLAIPHYDSIENDAILFRQSLSRDGNLLRGAGIFHLRVPELSPAQYRDFRSALETIEIQSRKKPVFAPLDGRAEADVEILHSEKVCDLDSPHEWTETHEMRCRVLTYAGARRYAELKFDFNPAWEDVRLDFAEVTSPRGETKSVGTAEQNVMDAEWVGSAPRYPPGKTLVVSLPGVEVGCVIHYRVVRHVRDRPFFAARPTFSAFDPIRWQTFVLDSPDDLEVSVVPLRADAVASSETRFTSRRVQRQWTARDVEAVKRERDLPPWWAFNPTICLSTGNWRTYADQVRSALVRATLHQPETKGRAMEIARSLATNEERVRAIRDFVARRVRNAGPPFHALPLSAISPADRTLADGYGNSADRAIVLYAMLTAAGLRPEFVLASDTPAAKNMEPPLLSSPHPADFPEVLVRVRVGGRSVYLNDTDEYAALGTTAHDGFYGLELSTGRIALIRAPEEFRDRTDEAYEIQIQDNGDALVRKTRYYRGVAFSRQARKFAEMTPEERRRYHQEAVAAIAQSAEPAGDLEAHFDQYPGREVLPVLVKRFAVGEDGYLQFSLPASLVGILDLQGDTRTNPLYWPRERRLTVTTSLTLPPGARRLALCPSAFERSLPSGAGTVSLAISSEPNRGTLEIAHTASLAATIMPAADYEALLDLQRDLDHPRSRSFLALQKPSP